VRSSQASRRGTLSASSACASVSRATRSAGEAGRSRLASGLAARGGQWRAGRGDVEPRHLILSSQSPARWSSYGPRRAAGLRAAADSASAAVCRRRWSRLRRAGPNMHQHQQRAWRTPGEQHRGQPAAARVTSPGERGLTAAPARGRTRLGAAPSTTPAPSADGARRRCETCNATSRAIHSAFRGAGSWPAMRRATAACPANARCQARREPCVPARLRRDGARRQLAQGGGGCWNQKGAARLRRELGDTAEAGLHRASSRRPPSLEAE
jgi:hypothetical protein